MISDDVRVSTRLGFPVVVLAGVGHMPAKGENEQEAARVFYVVATRATQRLVIGASAGQYLRAGSPAVRPYLLHTWISDLAA